MLSFLGKLILLPKNIYYNLKLFPFKIAKKMPLFLAKGVKIQGIKKGDICIDSCNITRFMISIGLENSNLEGVTYKRKSVIHFAKKSKIIFRGKCFLGSGICIRLSNSSISFGSDFYCNSNVTIICSAGISFGDDVILGWNVNIRDCDGHVIVCNGIHINPNKPISIGNHVWIGQNASILKGAIVGDGSIVGMNSCVTKSFADSNVVLAGIPAKIVKTNIEWKH